MAGLALLVLSLVAVVAVFLVFTRDDDELEEGDGERVARNRHPAQRAAHCLGKRSVLASSAVRRVAQVTTVDDRHAPRVLRSSGDPPRPQPEMAPALGLQVRTALTGRRSSSGQV